MRVDSSVPVFFPVSHFPSLSPNRRCISRYEGLVSLYESVLTTLTNCDWSVPFSRCLRHPLCLVAPNPIFQFLLAVFLIPLMSMGELVVNIWWIGDEHLIKMMNIYTFPWTFKKSGKRVQMRSVLLRNWICNGRGFLGRNYHWDITWRVFRGSILLD